MKELQGIVVDLDRCVGCFACELACKQENNVPEGEKWTEVIAIGPKEVNGKLQMDFLHSFTDKCTLCDHRLSQGLLPRCVENCPMEALIYFANTTDLLAALRSGKRVQVGKIVGEVPAYA